MALAMARDETESTKGGCTCRCGPPKNGKKKKNKKKMYALNTDAGEWSAPALCPTVSSRNKFTVCIDR